MERVENDRLVLTGRVWGALKAEAVLLSTLSEPDAAELLNRCITTWPSATILLLQAIEKTPGLPARLASVLLRSMDFLHSDSRLNEYSADALRVALPSLSAELRSVVFAIYPTLVTPAFTEGHDYAILLEDGSRTWPHDQNFPPIDTFEGRQARLRYLGHPTHDVLGEWGIASAAALIRFQIASELPVLGRWDLPTENALDEEAIGLMCMHRDDPSELFV